jgi:hypothetical protein
LELARRPRPRTLARGSHGSLRSLPLYETAPPDLHPTSARPLPTLRPTSTHSPPNLHTLFAQSPPDPRAQELLNPPPYAELGVAPDDFAEPLPLSAVLSVFEAAALGVAAADIAAAHADAAGSSGVASLQDVMIRLAF